MSSSLPGSICRDPVFLDRSPPIYCAHQKQSRCVGAILIAGGIDFAIGAPVTSQRGPHWSEFGSFDRAGHLSSG